MRAVPIHKAVHGRVAYDEDAKRWVWRCSACHRQAFWDDGWSWCGDWLNAEANDFEWVACSAECMAKAPKTIRERPVLDGANP